MGAGRAQACCVVRSTRAGGAACAALQAPEAVTGPALAHSPPTRPASRPCTAPAVPAARAARGRPQRRLPGGAAAPGGGPVWAPDGQGGRRHEGVCRAGVAGQGVCRAHGWPLPPSSMAVPTTHPSLPRTACPARLDCAPCPSSHPATPPQMKKTKPEPRACPECGEKVGLSAESVRVHLRLKHPASALARCAPAPAPAGRFPLVGVAGWAAGAIAGTGAGAFGWLGGSSE